MADQSLVARVRGWFRRSDANDGPSTALTGDLTGAPGDAGPTDLAPRNTLFHPFARQNHALQSLQTGFGTLTDLMGGIREHLERQGERQDQIIEQLSKLPVLLEQLPESARIQAETLKTLHAEVSLQHANQQRLTDILAQVSQSSAAQHEMLDGLSDRLDRSRATDEQMVSNLASVGETMQEMHRGSTASASLMENLRDNMKTRDTDLQQVLVRQGQRFTVMLSVAIFLSISALVAVAVIGYLLLTKPHG